MPGPQPWDHKLERLNACGWSLVEFGEPRELATAYRALTQQIELYQIGFRIVRPDGVIGIRNAAAVEQERQTNASKAEQGL